MRIILQTLLTITKKEGVTFKVSMNSMYPQFQGQFQANQMQQNQMPQNQFQQNQYQSQIPQNQLQQQIMPEPPRMISTKDHLYLQDAMTWELTAMKKCFHFSREATDPEIKAALDRTGQLHMNHYQRLLNHVNPANAINR
jgi:hypothetical protein